MFRADRDSEARRDEARVSLVDALHATARDIAEVAASPHVRPRLPQPAPQLAAVAGLDAGLRLGRLTPAQLARALGLTKRGAGKLLSQLETERLVRGAGPFAPYNCAIKRPVTLPDWRYSTRATDRVPSYSVASPVW